MAMQLARMQVAGRGRGGGFGTMRCKDVRCSRAGQRLFHRHFRAPITTRLADFDDSERDKHTPTGQIETGRQHNQMTVTVEKCV